MAASFRALAATVPGGSNPVGKEIAVVDLNWDGQNEILMPVGLQRGGTGGAIVAWDGVTPLDTPMLVMHYQAGVGLSAVTMKDTTGAALVTGWVMDISVADFNGDGHNDVLWSDTGPEVQVNGNFVGDTMRLYLSSPTGPVVSNATASAGTTPAGNGFWHAEGAGDINGDGKLDFVTINLGGGINGGQPSGTYAFLGDGSGGFTYNANTLPLEAGFTGKVFGPTPAIASPFAASVLQVADINGDGRADLALGVQRVLPGSQVTVRESRVFWNNGTGFDGTHFAALPMPAASVFAAGGSDIANISADRIRIGDINGDGRPDVLIKYADRTATNVYGQIMVQNADHSFTELPLWAGNKLPTNAGNIIAIEAWDVNNDGLLDVVARGNSVTTLSDIEGLVWINMGDGTLKSMAELAPTAITTPSVRGGYWTFADLDGDGQVELLNKYFTNSTDTTVQAYALTADRIQAVAGAATVGTIFGDPITGSAGADTINGGLGSDTIDGGAGQDYLRGDVGNDVINGGADFDDINGNKGDDTANGGDGDDWVVGGQGNDLLHGDANFDIVYGNLGNDTIFGDAGNDWVRGGQGDDVVSGGDGNDWLWGDRGNDTLTGGAGADLFHSFSGAGIDRITDFKYFEGDRIILDDRAAYTITQVGGDTIITIGGVDQVILVGVTASSLAGDAVTYA